MQKRLGLALALVFVVALCGCGKNASSITSPDNSGGGSSSSSADQAEVSDALVQSPEVVEDGEYESSDTATLNDGSSTGLAAIRPLRWWRNIRSVERSFEFAFSDTDTTGRPTKAVVVIHKRILGTLNIVVAAANAIEGGDPAPGDSVDVIHKPFADHWVRRVLLHRVRLNANDRPVWKIVASSGVQVTSRNNTVDIQSLRVQTANKDTTITDALAFIRLRSLIVVEAGATVRLTLTTNHNDDIAFLLARGGRFRFVNNGDGTYSGEWHAPLVPGIRHAGVNALSHGTLLDDTAPYDSQAWILPFVVRGPEPVAEYLP